jgi:putative transposase
VSRAAKRHTASSLESTQGVRERRACRMLALPRSSKRRQPGHTQQVVWVARVHALSARHPRCGYRQLDALLKTELWTVSRETVRRIRKREGLRVMKQARKRRPSGVSPVPLTCAERPNHVWSSNIVHDETTDGRRLTCLTGLDEYTRACLAIYRARSITASDVVRVLPHLCSLRGTPACLKNDPGTECTAKQVIYWCASSVR